MSLKDKIREWLGVDELIVMNNRVYDNLIDLLSGKISDLYARLVPLEAAVFPPEPPTPDIFRDSEYSTRADFPVEIAGVKVGYVQAGQDGYLHYLEKDDVLTIFEGPGNNTRARRLGFAAGKYFAVVDAKDGDYRYDQPRPTEHDGGERAYRIMYEQVCDGHDLTELERDIGLPHLYIKAADVADAWMPGGE